MRLSRLQLLTEAIRPVPMEICAVDPAVAPMASLSDRTWRLKYTPDDGDLVADFYVPALSCAESYDRSTGYFSAPALALAMRGIECLVRNGGRMRLVVGCTLEPEELAAIEKGEALRDAVSRTLAARPLEPPDDAARDALELLAWMIEQGFLEVKLAVPCDGQRRPMSADGIFHEKAGVIQDHDGNRLAFNGSINETYAGWRKNWESFNVFTSWAGSGDYAAREAEDFARLWSNKAKRVLVLDVPEAVKADLLRFMPSSDLPARLTAMPPDETVLAPVSPNPSPKPQASEVEPAVNVRRLVWSYVDRAPMMPDGGAYVGEATCSVLPWPHQLRAFERMYKSPAPRLLIADEVGLGKTIQAGLLLRQSWLARRATRILILTPAAVMRQWQLELREKFNLNWPVYDDGCLSWQASPGARHGVDREVARAEWHKEPVVIASSHLMRRRDREKELCEDAEPWDIIVLDEAHHARRRGAGSASEEGPNALLRLMRRLKDRSKSLILLTATPMQVHPVEVWDLLDLLGLPSAWNEAAFLHFFHLLGKPAPSHEEFEELAAMFRAAEASWGEVTLETMTGLGLPGGVKGRKIVHALRNPSGIPRRSLAAADRAASMQLMRATTPVSKLVSRHTRDLLRRYHKAGKISALIAERDVRDEFIDMTVAERAVYEAVENYISTTYNQAAQKGGAAKNAVGFVMTVYRRRLASSFRALRCTLEARLMPLGASSKAPSNALLVAAENASEDESRDEIMDAEEAAKLETEALKLEEQVDIQGLLQSVRALAPDSKARKLREVLAGLKNDGYAQVMVFTQFTDTMDFLRDYLVSRHAAEQDGSGDISLPSILCFSGRGGEALSTDGRWQHISRDEVKRRFREGQAEILLCTDAAAEGLNFQFCGALVNYDMPWNPMRVEQRIGRIDRLGQRHPFVRIVNLHYSETVEADVYIALRKRIGLFQSVVGKLQPILSQLPRTIAASVLAGGTESAEVRARVASEVTTRVDALAADSSGLDLDLLSDDVLDTPHRAPATLDLGDMDAILRHLDALPPGATMRPLGAGEYGYLSPGMGEELRVTTDAEFFEAHAESVELWSPGSPIFPSASALGGDVEGAEGEGLIRPSQLLNSEGL
ncbi:hypothetical protein BH09GEM1_BH09GEM1_07340 [soil metagenome]